MKVGQTLYLVPLCNFARICEKGKIFNVTIKSIGRKYGTLNDTNEITFGHNISDKFSLLDLSNENGDYSPEYQLFEDFNDIYNKPNLRSKISSELYGLSYSALLVIEKAIKDLNMVTTL